jgi:hypothetical protein
MIINGNLIGFGMFVVAALLIALGKYAIGLHDAVVMTGAGAALVTADLALRLASRARHRFLWKDTTGGYLVFMPVWIFGTAVAVVNLISAFLGKK